MAISPETLYRGQFAKAIMLCDQKIKYYKNKPEKAKKFEKLRDAYRESQSKVNAIIEKTKTIELVHPTDSTKPSFYDEFVSGKEDFVSLCWLSSKLTSMKSAGELTTSTEAVVDTLDFTAKNPDVKWDITDTTKSIWNQFKNGTGVSQKVLKGSLFVCLGELLTQGITSALAKEGIMQGAMGLIGLGKLGVAQLPKLLPFVESGIGFILGLPHLALIGGGVAAVVATVPAVKKMIDKVKKKHKNAEAFDKGMEQIEAEQSAHMMP